MILQISHGIGRVSARTICAFVWSDLCMSQGVPQHVIVVVCLVGAKMYRALIMPLAVVDGILLDDQLVVSCFFSWHVIIFLYVIIEYN